MDDYVSKPVRVAELIAALRRAPATSHPTAPIAFTPAAHATPQGTGRLLAAGQPSTGRPPGPTDADALLVAVRGIVGDQAELLLPELSDLFQDEGPRLLDAIRHAIANEEPRQLAAAAHTLKSSAASLGSADLPPICEQLETIGRSGTTGYAVNQLAVLEATYIHFVATLNLACLTLTGRDLCNR
jgi:two-component system sensor histidine kinase/response regulator